MTATEPVKRRKQRSRPKDPWWQRHPILAEKLLLAFNTFWQGFAAVELSFDFSTVRTAAAAGIAALLSFVPKVVGEALEHLRARVTQAKEKLTQTPPDAK